MSALKCNGGRWSALFGLAVLAAVFAVPAAAQFDPDPNSSIMFSQSLESETTFDLFENEYDYMLMPAYMGFFEDNGRYYTQLGNTGGRDLFQFGHYRPVGPGYLSFRVATSSEEFKTDQLSQTDDFDDDPTNGLYATPNIFINSENDKTTFDDVDAFVAYAWPLTDDSTLGFGVEIYSSSVEFKQHNETISDQRAGQGGFLSDDTLFTRDQKFEENEQWATLLGEYMRRGDTSWRVRGFIQDVDHEIKSDDIQNNLVLFDNPDEEGGGTAVSDEFDRQIRERGVGFGSSFGDTEGLSTGDFIDRVGYDGIRFGAEGDIRFEKNPELTHQLNVGVSTATFDAKDTLLFSDVETDTFITDNGGGSTTTDTQVFTDQHRRTGDDITWDNFFATWKTRWHRGDTHVGAGVYIFYDKMKTEIDADVDNSFLFFSDTDGSETFRTESFQDESFTASHETDVTSFSLPVALEQDINDRVQVRLGAAYRRFNVDDKYKSDGTVGDFHDITDPDGDGATAETETIFENREDFLDRLEFDDTFDEVLYQAGLLVKFDRVDLELLFTGGNEGTSSREGVDLNQAYVGATFKLGKRK